MPRDIPLGNGRLLICFDQGYAIRDLFYPHVGQENHLSGDFCRFGVWIEGVFHWVGPGWRRELLYEPGTMVTQVNLFHEGLGVLLTCRDAVDFHENIYLREVQVENLRPSAREIRLFFAQSFNISGNSVGDTAAFDPETGGLVHYKGSRYFLAGGMGDGGHGFSQFAVGQKNGNGKEGTYRDAEDGTLSGNPIAQGSVDSVAALLPGRLPGVVGQRLLVRRRRGAAGARYREVCRPPGQGGKLMASETLTTTGRLELLELEDFELLEFDLDLEIDGFDLGEAAESAGIATDITIIKRYPRPRPQTVKYERAADLVAKMPALEESEAMYAIVSGNFIFGDFIEAFMVKNNFLATELLSATLSLSQENVDSLKNLQDGGYVEAMTLIVSDFWYAHERRREGGVPYIVQELGGASFRFAAAGLHTKVAIIKTACGRHWVLHGSANLRSSRNVEQFCIENNEALYQFNHGWLEKIADNFSITKKSGRGDKLWQILTEPTKKTD